MTKPHLNHCRQLAELPEEVAVGDLTAISLAAGKRAARRLRRQSEPWACPIAPSRARRSLRRSRLPDCFVRQSRTSSGERSEANDE